MLRLRPVPIDANGDAANEEKRKQLLSLARPDHKQLKAKGGAWVLGGLGGGPCRTSVPK